MQQMYENLELEFDLKLLFMVYKWHIVILMCIYEIVLIRCDRDMAIMYSKSAVSEIEAL